MKLKESVKGVLGVVLLYVIVILGIVFINARIGQQKSVDTQVPTQNTNVNLNS